MAVTVEDVANVPRTTLHYYFAGREDLVNFLLNDHLDRVSAVIPAAVNSGGTILQRLDTTLRAILDALAERPALCTELPVALTQSGDFSEVVANTERVVLAPLRQLLIEGKATSDLTIPDLDVAVQSIMGAIFLTAMLQTTGSGHFDSKAVADALVPQLIDGLSGD